MKGIEEEREKIKKKEKQKRITKANKKIDRNEPKEKEEKE